MPVKKKVVAKKSKSQQRRIAIQKDAGRRKTRTAAEKKRINEMLAWAKKVLLEDASGGMVFIAKVTKEKDGDRTNATCVVTSVNRSTQLGAIMDSFNIEPMEILTSSLLNGHHH